MADTPKDKKEPRKKIVGLRTFADDLKRARAKQEGTPETEVVKPSESTITEKSAASKEPKSDLAAAVQGDLNEINQRPETSLPEVPTPPIPTKADKKHDASTEILPFHFIRASSPEDSQYQNQNEVEKDLNRKSEPTPTKPKIAAIPTQTLDTDSVPDAVASALSNKDGVFDTEDALEELGEGTIVTDKKREHFRLFPAIATAFKQWFGKKTEAIRETKQPQNLVTKASRRKEIIKAAAKQAKQTPVDDYKSVSERLKGVERITEVEELQIKDEAAVPEPTWSSVNEVQQAQAQVTALESLEAAAHEETSEPAKAEQPSSELASETPAEAAAQSMIPTPEVTKPAPPEPTLKPTSTVKSSEQSPPVTGSPATKEPLPVASPNKPSGYHEYREKYGENFSPKEDTFAESLPPAPIEPNETSEQPKLKRTPVPDYRLDRAGRPIPKTSGTPYLTFAAVILVAIMLGVGTSVWWFTRDSSAVIVTNEPTIPTNFQAAPARSIELSSNRTEFYEMILDQNERASVSEQEFYPTLSGQLAAPEQVFLTLGWQAPSSFARAVSSLTFGVSENQPFIIMRIVSFDHAFGGILAWENIMSADLAPLFGPAESVQAIDTRVNNRDVRILQTSAGAEKIVYGFVNKNTIVITSDQNTYARLAAKIK